LRLRRSSPYSSPAAFGSMRFLSNEAHFGLLGSEALLRISAFSRAHHRVGTLLAMCLFPRTPSA
jgi:hypothetical protein